MNKAVLTSALLGLMMVGTAGTAKLMVPTHYLADTRSASKLEVIVPASFGEWVEEKAMVSAVVNPSVERALKEIYTQTLSRTYVNKEGYRVMLSVAYGANQSDGLQVHYPEICYPAQGFELLSKQRGTLDTTHGAIQVKRLETSLSGDRFEPVTYWTTVGNKIAMGNIDKKLAEMSYRLAGDIPDGLLFRVSSIDRDTPHAFVKHQQFANQLLDALTPTDRLRLAGLVR
ncbi:exosortase-associated protein EpsI, B-type [Rugamonas aquatica]|uniref:EpsI family protein n=1 Tax=Rugamonas aquatica TaxID=2743357 RepID=A0A6A7MYZ4_9BURK|nr:exosortase-associated protein EpsI, B-type [Rugamonas aquatica]MQA38004.1 EpsI family protein [Rugamonas aquatica]